MSQSFMNLSLEEQEIKKEEWRKELAEVTYLKSIFMLWIATAVLLFPGRIRDSNHASGIDGKTQEIIRIEEKAWHHSVGGIAK